MSTAYKIFKTNDVYFVTLQVVGWVDIFTRKAYKDIVIESLQYCQKNKGLQLYAYVIMSNHIHLLVRSNMDNLSDIIRDFKSYTSKQFLEIVYSSKESRREWMKLVFEFHGKYKRKQIHQVWTNRNHAEIIVSQKFIEQKVEYIHKNPVTAGIVKNPEDYLYSSARNYAGLESVIDVIIVDFNWKTV